MKKFSRLLAVLLLAVMMMTTLTSCAQSESKKEDAVYNAISAMMKEYDITVTRDDALTKKAREFASLVESGTNLESNKKAGIAYAKVDTSKSSWADFNSYCLKASAKSLSNANLNVCLGLPYTKDTMALAGLLNNGGDAASVRTEMMWDSDGIAYRGTQKVGVAIATVKGDDYCVIFVEHVYN